MTSRFHNYQSAKYVNFFDSHALEINSKACLKDEAEIDPFLAGESKPRITDLG